MLLIYRDDVINMDKPHKSREKVMATLFPMRITGLMCWWIAFVFAILGIASEAASIDLVLETMTWILLSIAFFAASTPLLIIWALNKNLLFILYKCR